MNPKVVLACSALLMALTSVGRAAATAESAAPAVTVIFANPDRYTDVKSTSLGSTKDRDAILERFRDYAIQVLSTHVAPGQSLTVTFKDIDMAGDFEPWRVDARDVRIVKDLYPPRVKLGFKLVDASGAVVKEGDRSLSDLAFMNLATIDRNDELRYEKRLLGDWAASEFSPRKN